MFGIFGWILTKCYRMKTLFSWYVTGTKLISNRLNYTLFYTTNHKKYRIAFVKKRGPCHVKKVTTKNDENVTDIIKEYLGPGYNFYGIKTCPLMMGYDSLTFEYYDGTVISYLNYEDIKVV